MRSQCPPPLRTRRYTYPDGLLSGNGILSHIQCAPLTAKTTISEITGAPTPAPAPARPPPHSGATALVTHSANLVLAGVAAMLLI